MSADQREDDAGWCEREANELRGAFGDTSLQAARMRRLAAYARAPLAPPTDAEVEAAFAALWNGVSQTSWPKAVSAALSAFIAERNRA